MVSEVKAVNSSQRSGLSIQMSGAGDEVRPHSSLSYRTLAEFARVVRNESYGKDAGFACLENAQGVSHFATAQVTG
jgi:hypothetical protein